MKIQLRSMSDTEVKAGELYRYLQSTNAILLNRDGKSGGSGLHRRAEGKTAQDIDRLLQQTDKR